MCMHSSFLQKCFERIKFQSANFHSDQALPLNSLSRMIQETPNRDIYYRVSDSLCKGRFWLDTGESYHKFGICHKKTCTKLQSGMFTDKCSVLRQWPCTNSLAYIRIQIPWSNAEACRLLISTS